MFTKPIHGVAGSGYTLPRIRFVHFQIHDDRENYTAEGIDLPLHRICAPQREDSDRAMFPLATTKLAPGLLSGVIGMPFQQSAQSRIIPSDELSSMKVLDSCYQVYEALVEQAEISQPRRPRLQTILVPDWEKRFLGYPEPPRSRARQMQILRSGVPSPGPCTPRYEGGLPGVMPLISGAMVDLI